MARQKEIWKWIRGYKGFYEMSNLSRLRSTPRRGNHYIETIIKPVLHASGYLVVSLHKNGGRRMYKYHRLVAKSFIINPDKKPYINHKNGKKTDCRVLNLEWCTCKENSIHSYENGLWVPPMGANHPGARRVGKYLNGKLLKCYDCIVHVAKDKLSPKAVQSSLKGGWKGNGFDWKYLDNKKTA